MPRRLRPRRSPRAPGAAGHRSRAPREGPAKSSRPRRPPPGPAPRGGGRAAASPSPQFPPRPRTPRPRPRPPRRTPQSGLPVRGGVILRARWQVPATEAGPNLMLPPPPGPELPPPRPVEEKPTPEEKPAPIPQLPPPAELPTAEGEQQPKPDVQGAALLGA